MHFRKFSFLILCFAMPFSISGQTINLNEIDSLANLTMKDFDIPGMEIGIVRNDTVLFAKGYGTREINENLPVNTNTIFGIGSISKSFTALTLGILADQGKLNWDDRVKDYLPYFELYDPYVSENFTIRDLLTHRSGLIPQSGGMLWYHSDLNREEVIRGLKYLKPVSGFREKPAYQNVMFVVAGEIVKKVSGMEWDDFLKNNVFEKTGMGHSTSESTEREAYFNIARPHIRNDTYQKIAVKQEKGDNLAPGAFIYSSVNNMNNYMRLLLNNGVFQGDTIIGETALNEIFRPQILFPDLPQPLHNQFTSYGLGWWLTPIKDHIIIDHSGGIDGMSANLVMVKDLNVGIIVLSNNDELAPFIITSDLLKQILNDNRFDLYERIKSAREKSIIIDKTEKEQIVKNRILNTEPSLDLQQYAGTYYDKMYGNIFIGYNEREKTLLIDFPHSGIFKSKLKHWHYDTFLIAWDDKRVPEGFLTFNFNAQGEVIGFALEQKQLLDVNFNELEITKKQSKSY